MSIRLCWVVVLCFSMISARVLGQGFQVEMQQFDRWIFQGTKDPSSARSMLESRIDLEVMRIQQSTPLKEDQEKKIRLAGQGDIKRFYDDVDVARRQFLELGEVGQNQMQHAWKLAMPLQKRINRRALWKRVVAAEGSPDLLRQGTGEEGSIATSDSSETGN